MTGRYVEVQRASVHAGLHALSQPLTVVSLALTVAQASSSEAERALALEAAISECQRAMQSVRQLRSLLDEGMEPKLPVIGSIGASGTKTQWEAEGAA